MEISSILTSSTAQNSYINIETSSSNSLERNSNSTIANRNKNCGFGYSILSTLTCPIRKGFDLIKSSVIWIFCHLFCFCKTNEDKIINELKNFYCELKNIALKSQNNDVRTAEAKLLLGKLSNSARDNLVIYPVNFLLETDTESTPEQRTTARELLQSETKRLEIINMITNDFREAIHYATICKYYLFKRKKILLSSSKTVMELREFGISITLAYRKRFNSRSISENEANVFFHTALDKLSGPARTFFYEQAMKTANDSLMEVKNETQFFAKIRKNFSLTYLILKSLDKSWLETSGTLLQLI